MAGNSQRRGATRKDGSKKPRTVGSGGQRRAKLEGRGPTPKASERPGHKAFRAAKRAGSTGDGNAKTPRRQSTSRSGDPTTEMVAGRNPVVEAMRAGVPAVTLYVADRVDADDRVREAVRIAGHRGVPLLEVGRSELDRLTGGALHQGLALKVPPYRYAEPADLLDAARAAGEPALVVALDGVTDPRNLGAVVRSAAAFGAHGVVIPERRSAGMTASAWKTSAGAAARVPVARAVNLNRVLGDFQQRGCFVVGLDADGGTPLPRLDPGLASGPLVVVVGAEDRGLSRLVAERCDVRVSIPMHAGTESLNAGVAAGIALYAVACARADG